LGDGLLSSGDTADTNGQLNNAMFDYQQAYTSYANGYTSMQNAAMYYVEADVAIQYAINFYNDN